MSLAAGTLNRRIKIQRRVTGQDEAGQPLLAWEDVATLWADVKSQTGMGTIRNSGGAVEAVKKYSIRIRFRADLDEGMRVLLGGIPFDIDEIRMDYAGRVWTDLVCTQGGSDGGQ